MTRRIEIEGKKFGRLTVLNRAAETGYRGEIKYRCICDCGQEKVAYGSAIRRGLTRSCGCLGQEASRINLMSNRSPPKHGGYQFPEYAVWRAMRRRCIDPGEPAYPHYGGRGISVCAAWRESFGAFIADMGRRPSPQHSVDRINNDGNYEPNNCRWATKREQVLNRTRYREHAGMLEGLLS